MKRMKNRCHPYRLYVYVDESLQIGHTQGNDIAMSIIELRDLASIKGVLPIFTHDEPRMVLHRRSCLQRYIHKRNGRNNLWI